MWRAISFGCVAFVCLASVPAIYGQDSGPGPGAAGGDKVYDVTVIKFPSLSTGTFTFNAAATDPPAEGTTASVLTNGNFTSVLGTETSTGTWHAVDLGSFAIFVATAQGTSTKISAAGYANPDLIVGRMVSTSTTGSSRSRFLRALFSSSFFYGTAAEEATTTTAN